MISCTVLKTGDLKLTADNATRSELAELMAKRDGFYWSPLYTLTEQYWTNGRFQPFEAGDANPFVGLTDAPCIAESMSVEDDGTKRIDGRFWYFADYMIRDPLEDLRNKGCTVYQCGGTTDDQA